MDMLIDVKSEPIPSQVTYGHGVGTGNSAVKTEPGTTFPEFGVKQELDAGMTNVRSDASTSAIAAAAAAPVPPVDVAEPPLSPEQQRILDLVMQGRSLFFTGSAGVGKSVLTRAIIRGLRAKYRSGREDRNTVGVTATTGIAAINIGGCTLHSWAGCGLAKLPADILFFRNLLRKPKKVDNQAEEEEASGDKDYAEMDQGEAQENQVLKRWKECQVLVIDEGEVLVICLFSHC
jgi:hypothetical protein